MAAILTKKSASGMATRRPDRKRERTNAEPFDSSSLSYLPPACSQVTCILGLGGPRHSFSVGYEVTAASHDLDNWRPLYPNNIDTALDHKRRELTWEEPLASV